MDAVTIFSDGLRLMSIVAVHEVTSHANSSYAMAVRPGQVESAAVPDPSTLLLVGGMFQNIE